jgi:hypothetical protein
MSAGRRPQRSKQRASGFLQECVLSLVADLDKRNVGEARLPLLAHGFHDRVEVGSARDRLGDVVGSDELGGPGETGRGG